MPDRDDARQPSVVKRCPRSRRPRKKGQAQVPHAPHEWIAGVYYPLGEVDGWPAHCPGWPLPSGPSRE